MPTTTWDRLPDAKRSAVLEAAEAEFTRHGYGGASMNVIAREARVSKGSLFQYFADKSDLYVFLAERASGRIRAAMERRSASLPWTSDFAGALDELIAHWVGYFFDNPRDLALTAATNLEPDPLARAAVRSAVNRHYLAVVRPLVDLAVETGQLRPDVDVDALMALLIMLLPHFALAPHVAGLDPVLGLQHGDRSQALDAARRIVRLVAGPLLVHNSVP